MKPLPPRWLPRSLGAPRFPHLVGAISSRGDGNHLYIEELTTTVIEAAPGGEAISVPATLRNSLIARHCGSPLTKAVAQIASCIGRKFDGALLMNVSDIAERVGRFRFKHALLCDIAHETPSDARRQSCTSASPRRSKPCLPTLRKASQRLWPVTAAPR
jgi:hypothetical protein